MQGSSMFIDVSITLPMTHLTHLTHLTSSALWVCFRDPKGSKRQDSKKTDTWRAKYCGVSMKISVD